MSFDLSYMTARLEVRCKLCAGTKHYAYLSLGVHSKRCSLIVRFGVVSGGPSLVPRWFVFLFAVLSFLWVCVFGVTILCAGNDVKAKTGD